MEPMDLSAGASRGGPPDSDTLALEFDPRLADVWLALFKSGIKVEDGERVLGSLLRMAYLRGYEDALVEPNEGSLFTNFGLPVPARARHSNKRKAGAR